MLDSYENLKNDRDFDIFKELTGVIFSVPLILSNITLNQLLQIENLKIICTDSAEAFSN